MCGYCNPMSIGYCQKQVNSLKPDPWDTGASEHANVAAVSRYLPSVRENAVIIRRRKEEAGERAPFGYFFQVANIRQYPCGRNRDVGTRRQKRLLERNKGPRS